ncbi:hypothetical protein Dd1591_3693 [Dickeya chrysanthemi Ech1591]|uniref:Uncharacterized protein n=1 Tax=Dickeya chrysanthemi (strain Ech1591) TaxID=561229 RepID=C6CLJ6_DICC1|nr:SIR2 family protein [Dickeya chrysanthemi]ACT08499.1 hypothetical protein Dd1591_3693 [Dickeya chrysanthemi Ech1591]
MSNNPDGFVSFLKPGSSEWQPLNNEAFIFWRDRNVNAELPPDNDDLIFSVPLTDSDKDLVKDNRNYFNDILLRSLQLPNLSFFAGSGTSLGEVGGPSMWDLWVQAMWNNPLAKEDDIDYGCLKGTAFDICDKVNYSEKKHPNIEHFLSQCDAYLAFHNDEAVSGFLNEVKSIILEQCQNFIISGKSNLSSYMMLLQKMARRRVRDPRLKVFTTNYDMTFETSASALGMMVIDGFSYTGKRKFDGKYFNYDVIKRDENEHEFIEGVFQLYKLHGSVSWSRSNDGIYESNEPSASSACLIYPAKGKYQQAFIQPHLELLSRFLDSLRVKNSCLVISGFGFNDDHLSEPIYSAIKSNPSLRLIIADFKCATHIENDGNNGSSKYWKLFQS